MGSLAYNRKLQSVIGMCDQSKRRRALDKQGDAMSFRMLKYAKMHPEKIRDETLKHAILNRKKTRYPPEFMWLLSAILQT